MILPLYSPFLSSPLFSSPFIYYLHFIPFFSCPFLSLPFFSISFHLSSILLCCASTYSSSLLSSPIPFSLHLSCPQFSFLFSFKFSSQYYFLVSFPLVSISSSPRLSCPFLYPPLVLFPSSHEPSTANRKADG